MRIIRCSKPESNQHEVAGQGLSWRERFSERGLTLVELLVAMLVAGILLAAMVPILAGMFRTQRQVAVRTSTTADVRVAMDQMSRELRVASRLPGGKSAVISAQKNRIEFYAMLERGSTSTTNTAMLLPTHIVYTYNGSKKCVEIQTYMMRRNPNGSLIPDMTTRGSRCLFFTTQQPVFKYYSSTSIGQDATSTLVPNPTLTAAQLESIQAVQIELNAVDAKATDIAGSQIRNRVVLDNKVQEELDDPSLTPTTTHSSEAWDPNWNFEKVPGDNGGSQYQ